MAMIVHSDNNVLTMLKDSSICQWDTQNIPASIKTRYIGDILRVKKLPSAPIYVILTSNDSILMGSFQDNQIKDCTQDIYDILGIDKMDSIVDIYTFFLSIIIATANTIYLVNIELRGSVYEIVRPGISALSYTFSSAINTVWVSGVLSLRTDDNRLYMRGLSPHIVTEMRVPRIERIKEIKCSSDFYIVYDDGEVGVYTISKYNPSVLSPVKTIKSSTPMIVHKTLIQCFEIFIINTQNECWYCFHHSPDKPVCYQINSPDYYIYDHSDPIEHIYRICDSYVFQDSNGHLYEIDIRHLRNGTVRPYLVNHLSFFDDKCVVAMEVVSNRVYFITDCGQVYRGTPFIVWDRNPLPFQGPFEPIPFFEDNPIAINKSVQYIRSALTLEDKN